MKIETIINRVVRKYPNAILKRDNNKMFYVDNGNGVNLNEEFLLPNCKDDEDAWRQAELSVKTTKYFNKTHPNRLDKTDIEFKNHRISTRRYRRTK